MQFSSTWSNFTVLYLQKQCWTQTYLSRFDISLPGADWVLLKQVDGYASQSVERILVNELRPPPATCLAWKSLRALKHYDPIICDETEPKLYCTCPLQRSSLSNKMLSIHFQWSRANRLSDALWERERRDPLYVNEVRLSSDDVSDWLVLFQPFKTFSQLFFPTRSKTHHETRKFLLFSKPLFRK